MINFRDAFIRQNRLENAIQIQRVFKIAVQVKNGSSPEETARETVVLWGCVK